jgi:uncharacterized protein
MPPWTPLKPITETCSPAAAPTAVETRVGVRAALGVLRLYKLLISPYFVGSCRFLPSCSEYAAIAIHRHGVVRGSWLAARRLVRCHPLCAAGHDPVPS